MKAVIFFISAVLENGAQSVCQYFFYEKYFMALDKGVRVFFNLIV